MVNKIHSFTNTPFFNMRTNLLIRASRLKLAKKKIKNKLSKAAKNVQLVLFEGTYRIDNVFLWTGKKHWCFVFCQYIGSIYPSVKVSSEGSSKGIQDNCKVRTSGKMGLAEIGTKIRTQRVWTKMTDSYKKVYSIVCCSDHERGGLGKILPKVQAFLEGGSKVLVW